MELLQVALLGLAAGFISAFSTGGGMLTVPGLMLFGVPPIAAIATSRVGAISAGASSTYKFYRGRAISWRYMPVFLVLAVVAGILGPRILLGMDQAEVQRAVGILLLALLPIMLFQKEVGTKDRITPRKWKIVGLVLLSAIVLYATMFGAGSGVLFIYVLVYLYGMTVIEANATCTAFMMVASSIALIAYIHSGSVLFHLALPLAVGSLIGGYIGAQVALEKGSHWIKYVLATVVLISGIKLLFS